MWNDEEATVGEMANQGGSDQGSQIAPDTVRQSLAIRCHFFPPGTRTLGVLTDSNLFSRISTRMTRHMEMTREFCPRSYVRCHCLFVFLEA